jgi:hypothetical protein
MVINSDASNGSSSFPVLREGLREIQKLSAVGTWVFFCGILHPFLYASTISDFAKPIEEVESGTQLRRESEYELHSVRTWESWKVCERRNVGIRGRFYKAIHKENSPEAAARMWVHHDKGLNMGKGMEARESKTMYRETQDRAKEWNLAPTSHLSQPARTFYVENLSRE